MNGVRPCCLGNCLLLCCSRGTKAYQHGSQLIRGERREERDSGKQAPPHLPSAIIRPLRGTLVDR